MDKEAIIVVGLGYGDEGKGSVVDFLARIKKAGIVVRYNGGAQAGHNVVTPDDRHHTFSQFGSATFLPGVKTYLSRFMVINPLAMINEEKHLQNLGIKNTFLRTTIDESALVTTPFQIAVNRLLEIWRGDKKHGSCGMGVGRTVKDYQKYGNKVLFAKDLLDSKITAEKLGFLQNKCRDAARDLIPDLPRTETSVREMEWLEDKTAIDDMTKFFLYFAGLVKIVGDDYLKELIRKNNILIFEGAQGALLDKKYGFYPYITKTNTTFINACELSRENGYNGRITKIGVFRGYATRHGNGPFPTEDGSLSIYYQEQHNQEGMWQGKFRVGWQDLLTLRYGLLINDGVDYLAITNIDQVAKPPGIKICVSYEYCGEKLDILDEYFEWELVGKNRAKIKAFKKPDQRGKLTSIRSEILFKCRPMDFMKFTSPEEYIDFLQSKDGLNTPIRIISVGPTHNKKKILDIIN